MKNSLRVASDLWKMSCKILKRVWLEYLMALDRALIEASSAFTFFARSAILLRSKLNLIVFSGTHFPSAGGGYEDAILALTP